MDPQVQGSFIPKQALTAQTRGSGMGLLLMLVIIIFVLSVAAAAGAFGYRLLLQGNIQGKDKSLQLDEGAFDAASIDDLVRMDKRISQAHVLLQKHVSPSAIFAFLSTITLERVQFDNFEYKLLPTGGATIALSGVADSFSSVALQSDQFGATKVLSDVIFSGINVEGKSGKVSFSVNASVDPTLINYARNLTQQTSDTAQTQ